ncbi:hypothetical protein [Streptomyces pseudogriseolus]|uniref:hypothetical protein n=1 Tax=Streptomyces pseudogriseolus TaxID=36817 RepID=UPI003FA2BDD0
MDMGYWAVLADSEREQWGYVPCQTLGPLSFGDHRHDVVAIMAGLGFAAEEREIERWSPQRAQWRVEFRRAEWDKHRPAVKCYFVEDVGLTCVLNSREPFCCFTTSQDLQTFVDCHRRAFAHFGGCR